MAALDEVNIQAVVDSTNNGDIIRSFLKAELWAWYDQHKNDEVKTVNFWIIHRTIYVRDLYQIFILLLGPEQ